MPLFAPKYTQMKRIILNVCACLLVLQSTAQISIGPIVGMHSGFSHMEFDKYASAYIKRGWRAGAIAEVKMGKHFSLRPMLTVAKYGYEATPLGLYGIVNYNAFFGNGSNFFVGVGPYAATSVTKYKVEGPPGAGTVYVNLVKPLFIGAYANVGYQFKNGLFIAAHYEQVLSNMLRKDVFGPMPFKKQSLKYDDYGLSVGWLFKIAGKKVVSKKTAQQAN